MSRHDYIKITSLSLDKPLSNKCLLV